MPKSEFVHRPDSSFVGPELQRARDSLQIAQRNLSIARESAALHYAGKQGGNARIWLKNCEDHVLSALSWVWDAQERQRSTELQPYYDVISEGIRIAYKATLADFARRLLPKRLV